MSDDNYDFHPVFQQQLLSLYVRRPKRVAEYIDPSYFGSPIVAEICSVVSAVYKKHPKTRFEYESLKEVVKAKLGRKRRDDIWPEYKRIIRQLFDGSHKDDAILVDKAAAFAKERRSRKALVDAEKDINAQNYERAIRRFEKLRRMLATNGGAKVFHTFEDFENAPLLSFSIDSFLQNDAATLIGGLSGHGKTWIMLSMVKALLTGESLWGYFKVPKKAKRVLYLVPESSLPPIKHRLKRMGLYKYVKKGRLLVHTLSAGPRPSLDDPQVLAKAKNAHIFLDTAIRFGDGEENQASDNQKGLAQDIFTLLSAGARTVVGAHHSPKAFSKDWVMTLENVLRGSGDIGAMTATVWGVKQIDAQRNIIHIENVKPRDFEPPKPFQIIGRPWIDQEGDFRMHKRPGLCGSLLTEKPGSGAAPEKREQKVENIALVREWIDLSASEIVKKFKELGRTVTESTVRTYRHEIRKGEK